jgi:Flp pilus assembly protein TadG
MKIVIPPRRLPVRARTRGVAAVELALALPLLMMLVLGAMDYGYYMCVSITAAQAAREGARELSRISVGNCASTTAVNAAIALEQSSTGAASAYMGTALNLQSRTTVTVACLTAPSNPTWQVNVQVDYPPAVGYLLKFGTMPASTTAGFAKLSARMKMRGR